MKHDDRIMEARGMIVPVTRVSAGVTHSSRPDETARPYRCRLTGPISRI